MERKKERKKFAVEKTGRKIQPNNETRPNSLLSVSIITADINHAKPTMKSREECLSVEFQTGKRGS